MKRQKGGAFMHTLILGKQSAVIFFEPEEAELARRFTGRQTVNRELRNFLRRAGLDISGRQLYLELFENEGRCLLFVSPVGPSEPDFRLFRFQNADDLMDAIIALQEPRYNEEETGKLAGPSRLISYKSFYYLVLHPPFASNTAYLIEFGEELDRPETLLAHLSEHGTILSEPDALTHLARHFT
jgi:hypothetical protein